MLGPGFVHATQGVEGGVTLAFLERIDPYARRLRASLGARRIARRLQSERRVTAGRASARFLRNARLNSRGTRPNNDGAGVRRQPAEGPPDA